MVASDILVIGVGNEFAHDDAIGLVVARKLRQLEPEAQVFESAGDPTSLLQAWKGFAGVIIVNAVRSGAAPGKLYRFDARSEPLPVRFHGGSTHSFGLGGVIELARALQKLPLRLVVHGMEGKVFEPGFGLSPRVARSIEALTQSVLDDLRMFRRSASAAIA